MAQQPRIFISAGVDYRTDPIDIEDIPRGPIPSSTYGDLTGFAFWKVLSIHGRVGIKTKDNWLFSVVTYTRYNHNHFLEDPYSPSGPTTTNYNENTKDKEKIKFDIFFDVEKKIRVRKKQEKYLTILAGVGFTNINSGTDFTYRMNLPGGPSEPVRYKGSYLHFGPKLSLGYQYKRVKGSLDGYIIEDPLQIDLTSLWLGATISYELKLRKKKSK